MEVPASVALLPDVDIPGHTRRFHLLPSAGPSEASREALATQLSAALPEPGATLVRDKSVGPALLESVEAMWSQLSQPKSGLLIRFNSARNDAGVVFAPASSFWTVVGVGTEPLAALAAPLQKLPYAVSDPAGVRDESVYGWFLRDPASNLILVTFPAALSRALERDAVTEAARSNALGGMRLSDAAAAVAVTDNAAYWRNAYATYQARLHDAASRQQVALLNRKFQRAQDEFDGAYRDFSAIEREIAAADARSALLEKLAIVWDLAKPHLEEMLPSGDTAESRMHDAEMRAWREDRSRSFSDIRETLLLEAQRKRESMAEVDTMVDEAWRAVGVDLPPRGADKFGAGLR